MKGLVSIASLGHDELLDLIERASRIRDGMDAGAAPERALDGVSVANLFFEPSTRTRLSFDLAAQRLGAHVLTFDPATSSTDKGETLRDSVATVAAMGADILVVRHREDGTPQLVSEWTGKPVINGGDGTNEHPTQALLDVVTITRQFGGVDGLEVGIVGDIAHSRVAGSLRKALSTLDASVHLFAPADWMPNDVESKADLEGDLDESLPGLDVVYMLRVQKERGAVTGDDYIDRFQLDGKRASAMAPNAVVMHPGPINRGVELTSDVADSPRSLILEQVRNGVPSRMAVLEAIGAAIS